MSINDADAEWKQLEMYLGMSQAQAAQIAGLTAGLKGRKSDIFEEGVNVPFIIRWPEHVNAGETDTLSVISTVDLLPILVNQE